MKRHTHFTVEKLGNNNVVVEQNFYYGNAPYNETMAKFMRDVTLYQAMQDYAVRHGRAVSVIACELNTAIGTHVHQFVAVIDEQARLHIGAMFSK